ncbi:hypothetical protein D9619_012656 [Psilocybe cf. subviscida]|uniref:Uncharacterized protein n=1 Tax=Psilocybe cf. subviscida TaxID=2480587 RepID=A0A8H5EZI8_9AGAR|nr:hypothetical protein D9619_012656 [Psilocybe cf. subviscida]
MALFKYQDDVRYSVVGLPDDFPFASDIRVVPLGVAGITAALLVLQALVAAVQSLRRRRNAPIPIDNDDRAAGGIRAHMKHFGSYTIFGFMVARVLGTTVLLGLSRVTLAECGLQACAERFLTLTYLYSVLLGVVSIASKQWSTSATRYTNTVLLSVFAVYAYRDLWPLATFRLQPLDIAEGGTLWAKISILAFTCIFIPLFIPRKYVPVDPTNPMKELNPEQTASIISQITYSYVDPLIYQAYKTSSLTPEQLPPLRDFDAAKYQTDKAFKHLDTFVGAKRRYLFWGLMRTLSYEYTMLAILIIAYSVTSFISPIGIYQVLRYLETDGAGAEIRPWFWIIWLLAGPMLQSIIFQYELFVTTNVLVRLEGLFTQLVFNHSLRIRLKAETSNDPESGSRASSIREASSEATTPDSGSIAESSDHERTRSEASTLIASHDASTSTSTSPKKAAKGKGKAEEEAKVPQKSNENLIGKINNLITTDLNYITGGQDFLMIIIYVPLQVTLCILFLYRILGWSAIAGFLATLLALPIPGWLAKKLQDTQVGKMKKTDDRIQAVTEAVNVIRMVKLFGWEKKMTSQLEEKREEELKWLWKMKIYDTFNGLVGYVLPTVTMLISYALYALVMKGDLTASKIFSSMVVFSMLREQMWRLFRETGEVIQAKVSLDRVDDFLKNTELLDSFTDGDKNEPIVSNASPLDIGFRNAVFSWTTEADSGYTTPSGRIFKLRVDGELQFKRNALNVIIGPTGCGKTSMLMALLGEMHFMPSAPDSSFNLPRNGGIAYATQESWVQNETIRENILFGTPYDEERYKKVIKQCAMEHDLTLFEAGDATEVGERGLTLSGGQKARITLARAIYSQAQIILMDDILAALDVHTSTWIVNNCLLGDLVKDRTIILVTHNVALVAPIADFIVSIGSNGTVKSQTQDLSVALARDPKLAAEVKRDEEVLEAGHEEVAPPAAGQGKLILAEEVAQGHVSWKSIKLLIDGLGGTHPIRFFVIVLTTLMLNEWSITFQVWYIGFWGSQYEKHPASEVNVVKYLTTYSVLLIGSFTIYMCAYLYYQWGSLRASRNINKRLVDSVFGSTLRWLDETPTGRIIARCTQDIRAVDGPVPQTAIWVFDCCAGMVTKLGAIVLFTPAFLIPGMISAGTGLFVGNLYLKAQLSVKREMSNARSPLLSHFSAAIHGLVSIRAYGAQNKFIKESLGRIDHYTRMARMSWNINRWIAIRIDLIGATFTAALAFYLIYGPKVGAANTGFSLNMAVEFTAAILYTVRIYNMFEVQSNSLERIQAYVDIDHEPKPTERGVPPAAWPTSGSLRVENLSARYSQTGPKVLQDISFEVASGERIGVVGRTGSGKSSLTLSLLRCILTEGEIYLDGLLISSINLDALRSNVTIIPQMPELLSGTLRQNLDPFGQHDDAVLNDALRSAGLFTLQEEEGEADLSLDSKIAGGGSNLSVGQRQIIAIARAMIRESKLLILDEATSAIDYKTDIVIQNALRSQLGRDVTVITIAHRLQTVMDADKILVLDSGRIAEFGAPKDLLKNDKGILRALVDGSGDTDALYKLAGL